MQTGIANTTLFVIACFLFVNSVFAQLTTLDWKVHNVGKVRQLVTNMGTLDPGYANDVNYPGLIYCEFPPNSKEEHLFQGGFWIGAITPTGDTLVSVTKTHFTPSEFYPSDAPDDTIWIAAKGDTIDIPYWHNYAAVSNQDFICKYSDYHLLNIEDHVPLYLDVVQTSYAWSAPPLDEFIVFNYDVMPTKIDLTGVYVAFWLHGEVGTISAADNFIDDLTFFFPEQQMLVDRDAEGGNDGDAIGPIGIKVLAPRDTTLRWTYKHYQHEGLTLRDPQLYTEMSSGQRMKDLLEPSRSHAIVGFGPFEQIKVGDTLHFEIGVVLGYGLEALLKNGIYLEFLADRKYRVPSPPPNPPLSVNIQSHEIYLNWQPIEGFHNPETYQDPYRGDGSKQPFEGYRIYKSTISADGPWNLLAEYDVPDNIYRFNTGLKYEFTDIGLLNNFEYYYTVTAFSKPDDETHFPSQESSKYANVIKAVPGTVPPESIGEVAVVPNPYRGDIAYHKFDPPWEKPTGTRDRWMEQDRRIQFINLPAQCEIKIYTLAGDLIDTIYHNDSLQGYENWNLTSGIGQAISSGIYLFTAEDKQNGKVQVGKFIVIK